MTTPNSITPEVEHLATLIEHVTPRGFGSLGTANTVLAVIEKSDSDQLKQVAQALDLVLAKDSEKQRKGTISVQEGSYIKPVADKLILRLQALGLDFVVDRTKLLDGTELKYPKVT